MRLFLFGSHAVYFPASFDVIVIGGGHAGTEAALASALDSAGLEFSEADGKQPVKTGEAFRAFIAKLPKRVEFSELTPQGAGLDFSDPAALSAAAADLIRVEAGKGNQITSVEAVNRIMNQGA